MAQSRVYKIGTIYSRVNGLLVSGAIEASETPLWIAVYKAFPPIYEPKFDRELPYVPVKKIFYKEDILRSRFHKEYPKYSSVNLLNSEPSTTEKFLKVCAELEMKQVPESQIYRRALRDLSKVEKTFTLIKEVDEEDNAN